jgi:hypothetical protein
MKTGNDGYGKDILLFAIPAGVLRSVVIGYRSTGKSVRQLKM